MIYFIYFRLVGRTIPNLVPESGKGKEKDLGNEARHTQAATDKVAAWGGLSEDGLSVAGKGKNVVKLACTFT